MSEFSQSRSRLILLGLTVSLMSYGIECCVLAISRGKVLTDYRVSVIAIISGLIFMFFGLTTAGMVLAPQLFDNSFFGKKLKSGSLNSLNNSKHAQSAETLNVSSSNILEILRKTKWPRVVVYFALIMSIGFAGFSLIFFLSSVSL